jgi:hypothetical protein
VIYLQIPVMHDGGTTMHRDDGELDFHHGSSHVQYEATARNEPHGQQYVTFWPTLQHQAQLQEAQHGQVQLLQHETQPQQTQHAHIQLVPHAQFQLSQHAQAQLAQHSQIQPPQHIQQHIQHIEAPKQRKPSMREQGWIPIVGTPQGEWVPINKPGPPQHIWKQPYGPPKKFVYAGKPVPQKYTGPKPVLKQMIHAYGSQKMVPVPVAEHTLMLDIPHPFKMPDTRHEVVHIPEDQLNKYLAQMGVHYKTDGDMHNMHA